MTDSDDEFEHDEPDADVDVGFVVPSTRPGRPRRSVTAFVALTLSLTAHAGALAWAWQAWSNGPSVRSQSGVSSAPQGSIVSPAVQAIETSSVPIFAKSDPNIDQIDHSDLTVEPPGSAPVPDWTRREAPDLPGQVEHEPIGIVAAVSGSVHLPTRSWRGPKPAGVTETGAPDPGETGASAPTPDTGNAPPLYPREALRRRLEGTVVLEVNVDADGRCAQIRVVRSSGSSLLDDAAVTAVRAWRFSPAMQQGRAVASVATVPVRFVLAVEKSP